MKIIQKKIFRSDFHPFRPNGELIDNVFPDFLEHKYALLTKSTRHCVIKAGDLLLLESPELPTRYLGRVTQPAYFWQWRQEPDGNLPAFLKDFDDSFLRANRCRTKTYLVVQVEEWV